MQVTDIPLSRTGLMHELTEAYLKEDARLRQHYAWPIGREGAGAALHARAQYPVDCSLLARILTEQYGNLDSQFFTNSEDQPVRDNLRMLEQPDTYTVTTGHQLNIFTGPLYFIYKVISTIVYARQLQEAYPQQRFVPVYWMASEDHDFDEINHIHLWGKKLAWKRDPAGAVGDMETQSLRSSVLAQLRELIGGRPHGDGLLQIFEEAYDKPSLAQAHRALVHLLFRGYGLVIVGANHPLFKRKLVPYLEEDIFSHTFYHALNEASAPLQGFSLPIAPRQVNVFYLRPGSRSRIERDGERYRVLKTDIAWTADELRQELHAHPERFSPNVVLRPLYQEILLPNLAYIGGTNEVAYWLQLKQAFAKANVFYPQLVVRDSALWIGRRTARDIHSGGLQSEDILRPLGEIKNKFHGRQEEQGHPAEAQIESLLEGYGKLREDIQGLPADLAATLVKAANQHVKELKKWRTEIRKRSEEGEEKALSRLEKVYQLLYPDGVFQERHDNFIALYMQYGPQWMAPLFDTFNPSAPALHIYTEE